MSTSTRRRFYSLAAFTAVVGIIGYASVILAREAAPAGGSVFLRDADVLSPAVRSEVLGEFLASEDAARGFREAPAMPSRPDQVYHATLYLPDDQSTMAPSTFATGVVIARLDAKSAFAPLGLAAGKNYLWVDAKGPPSDPWRGIMISADGKTRNLLPGFKYTPDSDHTNGISPLDHARLYCNGAQGCLFFDAAALEAGWMRCPSGCCEVTGPCRPPCAKSEVR